MDWRQQETNVNSERENSLENIQWLGCDRYEQITNMDCRNMARCWYFSESILEVAVQDSQKKNYKIIFP